MAKYTVTITESNTYLVEADCIEEAAAEAEHKTSKASWLAREITDIQVDD